MRANDAAVVNGSEFPDWMTPPELYRALDLEVQSYGFFPFGEPGISTDLAASATSHLAPHWLGPGSTINDDSLKADWHLLPQPCFLNPPYSRELNMPIEPWVEKLVAESARGGYYFSLLPHRPDTKWWRLTKHAAEIREIPHRVKFILPPEAFAARNARRIAAGKAPILKTGGAGFPSALVIWHPQPGVISPALPRRVTWDYLVSRKAR